MGIGIFCRGPERRWLSRRQRALDTTIFGIRSDQNRFVDKMVSGSEMSSSDQSSGVSSESSARCRDCDRELPTTTEQYACLGCRWWPLCGRCILRVHIDHGQCMNTVRSFTHQLNVVVPWQLQAGRTQYNNLRKICRRFETAKMDFDMLFRSSHCRFDPIFSDVVNRYCVTAGDFHLRYADTVRQYEDLQKFIGYINRFMELGEWPDEATAPFDVLESVESVPINFGQLATIEEEAEEALTRLENVNRLLQSAQPATDVEHQKKKELGRSKSFHDSK